MRGERIAISRAITLIESTRESHRYEAEALIDYVVKANGAKRLREKGANHQGALRVGVAGPPGAGKSTFIEALGKYLIEEKGMVRGRVPPPPS